MTKGRVRGHLGRFRDFVRDKTKEVYDNRERIFREGKKYIREYVHDSDSLMDLLDGFRYDIVIPCVAYEKGLKGQVDVFKSGDKKFKRVFTAEKFVPSKKSELIPERVEGVLRRDSLRDFVDEFRFKNIPERRKENYKSNIQRFFNSDEFDGVFNASFAYGLSLVPVVVDILRSACKKAGSRYVSEDKVRKYHDSLLEDYLIFEREITFLRKLLDNTKEERDILANQMGLLLELEERFALLDAECSKSKSEMGDLKFKNSRLERQSDLLKGMLTGKISPGAEGAPFNDTVDFLHRLDGLINGLEYFILTEKEKYLYFELSIGERYSGLGIEKDEKNRHFIRLASFSDNIDFLEFDLDLTSRQKFMYKKIIEFLKSDPDIPMVMKGFDKFIGEKTKVNLDVGKISLNEFRLNYGFYNDELTREESL